MSAPYHTGADFLYALFRGEIVMASLGYRYFHEEIAMSSLGY